MHTDATSPPTSAAEATHPNGGPAASAEEEVDLNQVVAFNLRAARQMRGWTQEQLADHLQPYLGRRLSQASVSGMERASGRRGRRYFDAHELLIFAMVFDLPVLWFLLPPPGEHRAMRGTRRSVDELFDWVVGGPRHGPAIDARLRAVDAPEPTATAERVERAAGKIASWISNHRDSVHAAAPRLGIPADAVDRSARRFCLQAVVQIVDDPFSDVIWVAETFTSDRCNPDAVWVCFVPEAGVPEPEEGQEERDRA